MVAQKSRFLKSVPHPADPTNYADLRHLFALAWAVIGLCQTKTVNFNKWSESVISLALVYRGRSIPVSWEVRAHNSTSVDYESKLTPAPVEFCYHPAKYLSNDPRKLTRAGAFSTGQCSNWRRLKIANWKTDAGHRNC